MTALPGGGGARGRVRGNEQVPPDHCPPPLGHAAGRRGRGGGRPRRPAAAPGSPLSPSAAGSGWHKMLRKLLVRVRVRVRVRVTLTLTLTLTLTKKEGGNPNLLPCPPPGRRKCIREARGDLRGISACVTATGCPRNPDPASGEAPGRPKGAENETDPSTRGKDGLLGETNGTFLSDNPFLGRTAQPGYQLLTGQGKARWPAPLPPPLHPS